MYAGDTNIYRKMRKKHDQKILQNYLIDILKALSNQWILKFHSKQMLWYYNWEKKRIMITHIVLQTILLKWYICDKQKLSYPERLKYLRFSTIAYRRARGGGVSLKSIKLLRKYMTAKLQAIY